MKQAIPLTKQSKKAQKAFHTVRRGSWNGVDPVTKIVPSGKAYKRSKFRHEARSLVRSSGEEWAEFAFNIFSLSDRGCCC